MHVLHVIPGLTEERGGPSAAVQAMARELCKAGHRVTVLTTDQGLRQGERPVEMPEGVAVVRAAVVGPDRIAYAPGFLKILRSHLEQADIIHAHSIFTYPVHLTLREAAKRNRPLVLRPCGQLHSYSLGRSGWRKAAYLRAFGSLVQHACSAWHYTSEAEAAASWGRGRSFVLPLGIDPDAFQLDRREASSFLRRRWPRLARRPYVLFLGRFHPKKRADLLIRSFLAGAPRSCRLVLAGPDESQWWESCGRRLVPDWASSRVVCLGPVYGQEKAALLGAAALFALPSEHENFGLAALESLAAGTPVLLSPHVDLATEVQRQHMGWTAPLDQAAWTERIRDLLGDCKNLELVGRDAQNWVRQQFHWPGIVACLVDHYARFQLPANHSGIPPTFRRAA